MVLLATLLAVSAPLLSRSFKQRGLEQEAMHLLAFSEYARDEAVSQGVPMIFWIDPDSGDFGVQAKEGYEGDTAREKTNALNTEMHFDPAQQQSLSDADGHVVAAEFEPDGTLNLGSLASLRIVNRAEEGISLMQTADGWGYEIVEETP